MPYVGPYHDASNIRKQTVRIVAVNSVVNVPVEIEAI
jgi:hypothetical protein